MKFFKKTKLLSLLLATSLMIAVFSGCSTSNDGTDPKSSSPASMPNSSEAVPTTITYALADPQDNKYWDSQLENFCKEYKNYTVDIECFGGTDDMMKNLKIRQSADQLPDIIQLKPDFINDLKDSLMVWDASDETVTKNSFAKRFEQDGKIYGLPLRSFNEFVYYKKSIFKELKLEIPQTWEQFIKVCTTIKESGKYTPIAMGAKDVWPVYPFNEFMPHLVANDEKILSNIAKQDEPFSKGGGFYDAYSMINDLYSADVMGPDPLGVGCDQSQQVFESNQAAMIVLGQWYLPNYIAHVGNTDDLGFFSLPVVKEGEKNRVMTMADNFLTINKNSKNLDAAKEFITWSFSNDVYKGYLEATMNNSTVEGVTNDNPLFKEYRENSNAESFLFYPGNSDYSDLVNQTKLDTKSIGQRMLSGEKYDSMLKDLNNKWKTARKDLGIK